MSKYLAVIGTSYPEIHGATNVTEFFCSNAKKYNLKILRFTYKNYFFKKKNYFNYSIYESKIARFFSFMRIFINLIFKVRSIGAAYIQENAGLGKLYDLCFLTFFLMHHKKCFYHNHTYKKINNYDILTKIIQTLSRFGIKNIFQSKVETNRFISLYGHLDYIIISNSVFLEKNKINLKPNIKNKKINFGFLSNLNRAKGLDKYINIARKALNDKKNWDFFLAGPITESKDFYLEQIKSLKNIKYNGPINKIIKKNIFYQNIDFFVFLSTYKNESEALVMLEAISNGCIPIVFDQGTVAELVPEKKLIIKNNFEFYNSFVNLVEGIIQENQLELLSKSSLIHFEKIKEKSQANLANLYLEIKKFLK